MTERIILSIVSIIMLALSLKKGDKQSIIFTIGLTIGILITWSRVPVVMTIGLVTYMLTALMIVINSLRMKELSNLNQVTIIFSGIWTLGANLFSIMHWPYADEIRLSMIIPIIFYIISLIYGMTNCDFFDDKKTCYNSTYPTRSISQAKRRGLSSMIFNSCSNDRFVVNEHVFSQTYVMRQHLKNSN